MNPRLFSFTGGDAGSWRVLRMETLRGPSLDPVARVQAGEGEAAAAAGATWTLRGLVSHDRYVTRVEKDRLAAVQEGLGRPASLLAALIPIRKTAAWWALTQDERRAVFEESSHHIQIGMRYLPAVARRLHHCRDLAEPQPFDFLTWFEFAPADGPAFDAMLAELRATPEWTYVDREVDIRLERG
jgi:hypothetical protein